jgi:ketosteroid isomerase-like protein
LRERYERYSEGDLERVLDLWTDDFVWVGDDSGLPGSGGMRESRRRSTSFRRRSVRMTSMSDRRGIL